MKKRSLIFSIAMIGLTLSSVAQSNEIEFMCKTKAKELAAATYKDCISESKQAEIQRIRSEYQAQISDLKSKYNSQLEKLSGSGSKNTEKPKAKPDKAKTSKAKPETLIEDSDIPAFPSETVKKMNRQQIKTERIDLTETAIEETKDMSVGSTEIIEIPIQSE
jgi:hypothetical protein